MSAAGFVIKPSSALFIQSLYWLFFFFKGAVCSFGGDIQTQNFYIYNINEVIIQNQIYFPHKCINKLFSGVNKAPSTLFGNTSLAGSATYKQSKNSMELRCTLRSVCLFSLFNHENVTCVSLFRLFRRWRHRAPLLCVCVFFFFFFFK